MSIVFNVYSWIFCVDWVYGHISKYHKYLVHILLLQLICVPKLSNVNKRSKYWFEIFKYYFVLYINKNKIMFIHLNLIKMYHASIIYLL